MNMHLVKGYRYTFYYRIPGETTETTFRANYVNIYQTNQIIYSENREPEGIITHKTLTVNTIDTEISKRTIWSTPMEWITRVENLDSILENHTNLPTEILNEIDRFV